ncbi:MAG TPA: helix-turn-helix domain-containing protein [Paraburkholderia sp.]|nr:helix-turn-helix domain-containing protein [Paraburkholderia sp.]
MPTTDEKLAFSERLKLALRRVPEKPEGPTAVARFFNLRYHGEPVSTQTVDKWLKGRTIPKADKLETLAKALNVDLHWLHYGPAPNGAKTKVKAAAPRDDKYPPSPETIELANKIGSLTPHHRYLVQELVAQFYDDVEKQ